MFSRQNDAGSRARTTYCWENLILVLALSLLLLLRRKKLILIVLLPDKNVKIAILALPIQPSQ